MNDDEAKWLPAPGAPGYEVSSDGRVRSVPRLITYRDNRKPKWHEGCERKTFLVKGYLHVTLNVHRRKKNFYVHLLVCEAFHGQRPSPSHEARHLNGIEIDNNAENLMWGTKSENAQDTLRHGNNPFANKTHCPRNHPYGGDNLAIGANGGRRCRECSRLANRRYYEQNKLKVLSRQRAKRETKAEEEGRQLRSKHRNALYPMYFESERAS